jgi:hypothetical protein
MLWLLPFGGNSKSYIRVDKPSPSQAEMHKRPRSPTQGRLLPVDFGSCDFHALHRTTKIHFFAVHRESRTFAPT